MPLILFVISLLFSTILLAVPNSASPSETKDNTISAFDYLNKLRHSAGMPLWIKNKQLKTAAQNHADYLNYHRQRGHYESRGRKGYTGNSHSDRIVYAGYPSRQADENTSFHNYLADDTESIDGLMAAIYHRLAFLSFDFNEIGTGISKTDKYTTYVYNMGNTQKRELCESRNNIIHPGQRYFTRVCANKQDRIESQMLQNALISIQQKSPNIVVWPPENGTDIPPAFYEEQPDPLPFYDVSGYPVSIQFNPAVFSNEIPQLSSVELINSKTNIKQELITILNKNTDPHRKLSAYDHAAFPLKRLEWDTKYQVITRYLIADKEYEKSWSFRTRKLSVPVIRLGKNDNRDIKATPGKAFALYIPPKSELDSQSRYNTRYYGQSNITIKFIDDHTLLITPLNVKGSTSVTFHGQKFTVST